MRWAIREAVDRDDVAAVKALFREYEQWLGADLCFRDFEQELASLPGPYARPNGALLLALLDRQPCGCAAIRPADRRETCELKRLYVAEHGRGLGIGLALTRRAMREAQKAGYRWIRLDTLRRLDKAIALYKGLGFQEVAPYIPRAPADVVFMERAL